MAAPSISKSSLRTYTNTGIQPLDGYRDEWKVYVVDKIWAAYRLYPIQANKAERKEGRAIAIALANALKDEYGAGRPIAYSGPFGEVIVDDGKDHSITAKGVEEILGHLALTDQDEWYTYRAKAMWKEWNGTQQRDGTWSIEPQKAETAYIFYTIGEVSPKNVAQPPLDVIYRQFNWSPERKRILKLRENARRGKFENHAVYKNHPDDWRYFGGPDPVDGGHAALSPDAVEYVEARFRSKGVSWEDADGPEFNARSTESEAPSGSV
ncbi:hypothetical protein MMC18_003320 [Xylographa bjoerkii]|nr:hypothetical protein [Xylographa bjoerkii]